MADAMNIVRGDNKGVLLEGEGHGFIKPESHVLEKEEELHWWKRNLIGIA